MAFFLYLFFQYFFSDFLSYEFVSQIRWNMPCISTQESDNCNKYDTRFITRSYVI